MQKYIEIFEEYSNKENAFCIKVERDFDVQPKKFHGGKYLNFFVKIFLEVDESASVKSPYLLEDISFVKYKLDKTYKQRVRISENPLNKFEIKVWTYGYYSIQAKVFPKYGASFLIQGFVSFPVSDEEKSVNASVS
jgi:hypothetical protein